MSNLPDLTIVIVSYNVRELLRRCLNTIDFGAAGIAREIVVVDNCSTDGSAEMVRSDFPTVTLLKTDANRGYAFGNNLGLRLARERHGGWPRYVLLLNPDTELTPGSLRRTVEFLDAHPEAGAAGVKLLRPNGQLDLACRRSFPTPEVSLYRMTGLSRLLPRSRRFGRYNLTYLDPDSVHEVDSVVGAFMMVRGSLLDEVGLLDESFFMYGEDLDWAYRIKAKGWRVLYDGRVTVLHHKGASSTQRSRQSILAFYEAMLIFFRKHYSETTSLPVRCLVVAGIYGSAALALGRNLLKRRPARLQVSTREAQL